MVLNKLAVFMWWFTTPHTPIFVEAPHQPHQNRSFIPTQPGGYPDGTSSEGAVNTTQLRLQHGRFDDTRRGASNRADRPWLAAVPTAEFHPGNRKAAVNHKKKTQE